MGKNRILMVRLDRIGDLALTLACDRSLPEGFEAQWWISENLGFLAEASEPPRSFLELPRKLGLGRWLKLFRELRKERPKAAVIFHAHWTYTFLIWAARVPIRIGVLSQWHSFLFLNRGIRQKRSQATLHEQEYGCRLVEEGFRLPQGTAREQLRLKQPLAEKTRLALLAKRRLPDRQFFVVHPGMGGSAVNWPLERWAEAIRKLALIAPVAITGTSLDEPMLSPLRRLLESNPAVRWLDGALSTRELLAVLSSARATLAPSTGVLHLAAALGGRAVGLYSPVRVQAPLRWRPLGPQASYFVPAVDCPGRFSCLGPACSAFNCLSRIEVEEVISAMTSTESLSRPSQ